MKEKIEFQFKHQSEPAYLPLETLSTEVEATKICKFYHYHYNSRYEGKFERHDAYELFYVITGSMRVTIEDTTYILNAKQFILVPPMHWHFMSANKEICSSMCCIFTSNPLNDALIANKVGTFSEKEFSVLEHIGIEYINNLVNDCYFAFDKKLVPDKKNSYGFRQALKTQIEYLLILITRQFLPNADDSPETNLSAKENAFIQNVLAYINENITAPLSLNKLAAHFKYSDTHFSRIFKKATGETVTDYILKAKVQKAMVLFATQNYSVQYVSDHLNFGCVQYFSKIFKRFTGLSPMLYKRNCAETNLMSTEFLMTELI